MGLAEQDSSVVWLTDRTQLDLERPETLLFGEVWTTAAGEQGSIFAWHPSQLRLEADLVV
jgi:hypothetical protein